MAADRPLLLAVDDAHWGDEPSLRWLSYLAPRLGGLAVALIVAIRPSEPASTSPSLLAVRAEASVIRPQLLSEAAVAAVVRAAVGERASDELCAGVWAASGGNPFYATELLRGVELDERFRAGLDPAMALVGGRETIAPRVVARLRATEPPALALAQALAVLGDGCELRQAAVIAGVALATPHVWQQVWSALRSLRATTRRSSSTR